MKKYSYTPLSLESLCINIILQNHWNSNFYFIYSKLPIFLQEEYWIQKIKKRHEIIKICL